MAESPGKTAAGEVTARRVRSESTRWLVICAAVLAASFWLQPDPEGFGTHRQLLMPPCFFRTLTRVPCPFCGMTTGFAHMARGEVRAAFVCSIMAPPAFGLTILLALGGLWGVTTGRKWWPKAVEEPGFPRSLLFIILLFWAGNLVVYNVLTRL
jgi:hypothetical protein